jgi:murein L,D-transpeptidase YafK
MTILKTGLLFLLLALGSGFTPEKSTFEDMQKSFPRVKDVYERKEEFINMKCRSLEIPEETFGNILIRVFKMECIMEVWVQKPDGSYIKFKEFNIYALSGVLGPKRREGDMQVPEGYYYIKDFNPQSNYYLSLGINYPNESDMKLSTAERKGRDIYIHGAKCSAGCLAMSNYYIEDIYMCAVKAHGNGQQRIPVEIFPFKMTDKNMIYYNHWGAYQRQAMFWNNIRKGYDFFEKNHRVPEVAVADNGNYLFSDPATAQASK